MEKPVSDDQPVFAHFRSRVGAASGNAEAKRSFAAALREVLEELDASGAPSEALLAQADQMRRFAGELRSQPKDRAGDSPSGFTGMEGFPDRSPISGFANPLAPPATLVHDSESRCVRGEVEFGKVYEGGPGLVHGGFLAALLDEALGLATVFSGKAGMTGEYTVRFVGPTRIKVPLRFEARFDRREGRKIYVSSDLWDGDRLTVKATGTFISVEAKHFEGFHTARSERIGDT
jgi:acyl-coenzyme A thioesterase PaaI-like protein